MSIIRYTFSTSETKAEFAFFSNDVIAIMQDAPGYKIITSDNRYPLSGETGNFVQQVKAFLVQHPDLDAKLVKVGGKSSDDYGAEWLNPEKFRFLGWTDRDMRGLFLEMDGVQARRVHLPYMEFDTTEMGREFLAAIAQKLPVIRFGIKQDVSDRYFAGIRLEERIHRLDALDCVVTKVGDKPRYFIDGGQYNDDPLSVSTPDGQLSPQFYEDAGLEHIAIDNSASIYFNAANLTVPQIINGALFINFKNTKNPAIIRSSSETGIRHAFELIIEKISQQRMGNPAPARTNAGLPPAADTDLPAPEA